MLEYLKIAGACVLAGVLGLLFMAVLVILPLALSVALW